MERKNVIILLILIAFISGGVMAQSVNSIIITVPTSTGDSLKLDLDLTPKPREVSLRSIDAAYDNKDYEQAIEIGESTRDFYEEIYGKGHAKVIDLLQKLADSYFQTKQYEKAIEIEDTVYHRLDNESNYADIAYLNSITNLAKYYNTVGDSINGMNFATEAVSKWGEVSISSVGYVDGYAKSLSAKGSYYAKYGDYQNAILFEGRATRYIRRKTGRNNFLYGNSLRIISEYEARNGNYDDAIYYAVDAVPLLEGGSDALYVLTLYNLSSYYEKIGNYDEVINYAEKAANAPIQPQYIMWRVYALENLAKAYKALRNWPLVVKYFKEALDACGEMPGDKPILHYAVFNGLVNAYSVMGDYITARRLALEAVNYAKQALGNESDLYATALNNTASYMMSMGYTEDALIYAKEAVEVREKARGKGHELHVIELRNLCDSYRAIGDYQSMKDVAYDAVQLACDSLGTGSLWHSRTLGSLAEAEYYLGNINDAIKYGEEARRGTLVNEGKECSSYAMRLWDLSRIYFSLDSITKAVELATEAIDISMRVGSIQGAYMIEKDLLTFYNRLEDQEMTEQCALDVFNWATGIIRATFLMATEQERNNFWNMHKNWYEVDIHRSAYCMPTDVLSSVGYNGSLLSKGLLLSSAIELSRIVSESKDQTIMLTYDKLLKANAAINVLQTQADETKRLRIDSLRNISEKLEIILLDSCKTVRDYTANLAITWEQVQEKLNKSDAAIEFISFPLANDSTVMYIAYVLRKGWKSPKMIPLFTEQQLKMIDPHDYYRTDNVSKLVWEPLSKELEGASVVYFAPSGELYNIAIEHVPDYATNGSALVSDSRVYYRLSSTRELALKREKDNWKDAAVYGGLTYGMNAASIINNSRSFSYDKADLIAITGDYYSIADTLMRAGLVASDLKGTRNEAVAIDKALENSGISTTLYMDSIGTEASFKKLSGKKKSIMHIGTHGFYWTEHEAQKYNYDFLLHDDQSNLYVEDKQLTRSGLLFAGANYSLSANREKLPEDVDDGILTAKELTSIDLGGLDLVVLSACQTGLGEITGDGVFGLQRGFKKAGAQTIIMSLWKVNDKATELFMTKFFEEIKVDKNGHPINKHEAYLAAQNYLRKGEAVVEIPPSADDSYDAEKHDEQATMTRITFEDPKFWAAFIMLDGID